MKTLKHLEKLPVWYQPEAPLGSAVRYVASLSPKFNWVGIYVLKGKFLKLDAYVGTPSERRKIPGSETRSELVVLVRDRKGRVLGQIDIDSHTTNAFGSEEEEVVRKIAAELGELWPE